MLTLRVSANLNIGHNDEIHSSQPSVLSSAAVQRLGNWDYPLLGEITQNVVLFINLICMTYHNASQFFSQSSYYKLHMCMCIAIFLPKNVSIQSMQTPAYMHGI